MTESLICSLGPAFTHASVTAWCGLSYKVLLHCHVVSIGVLVGYESGVSSQLSTSINHMDALVYTLLSQIHALMAAIDLFSLVVLDVFH